MPFSAKSRTPEFSFSSTIGDRDETFNNSFAFVALFRYVFKNRKLTSKKVTPLLLSYSQLLSLFPNLPIQDFICLFYTFYI